MRRFRCKSSCALRCAMTTAPAARRCRFPLRGRDGSVDDEFHGQACLLAISARSSRAASALPNVSMTATASSRPRIPRSRRRPQPSSYQSLPAFRPDFFSVNCGSAARWEHSRHIQKGDTRGERSALMASRRSDVSSSGRVRGRGGEPPTFQTRRSNPEIERSDSSPRLRDPRSVAIESAMAVHAAMGVVRMCTSRGGGGRMSRSETSSVRSGAALRHGRGGRRGSRSG